MRQGAFPRPLSGRTSPMRLPALLFILLSGVLLACAAPTKRAYPDHWWTPVPAAGAPTWEILPQAAGPGEVILSKRHELGLLSNFAPTPFTFRGKTYASMEGFWQAMLFPESPQDPRARAQGLTWAHSRAQVEQMTAFEAKSAGEAAAENMRKLGINWVTFEGRRMEYRTSERGEHFRLIAEAMREKVRQNPRVREVLLQTGDLKLMPDHKVKPDAPPAWRYNEIMTEIRAELRNGDPVMATN